VTDLPELVIDVTPTFVVASAIATRDFQDVHHDRDRAVERGSKDIFINILTTTGLVQRYVTDWAGSEALVRKVAIRLGVPCYAGDTLTFSGRAAAADAHGEVEVTVTGRCSLGDHVTGTVRLVLPPGDGEPASWMYQTTGYRPSNGTFIGSDREAASADEADAVVEADGSGATA
jgi:MaoC like domain